MNNILPVSVIESLRDLDASLKSRNSRLIVLRGSPDDVLVSKMKEWNVSKLCFESDTEPYAKARDGVCRARPTCALTLTRALHFALCALLVTRCSSSPNQRSG